MKKRDKKAKKLTGLKWELAAVSLVTAGFFFWLLKAYTIRLGHSDVVTWFSYGINFPERFGETKLGFGFPLVLYITSKLLGKLNSFLINIPVLTAIIPAFYVFARNHIPKPLKDNKRAFICAIVTITAFVHLNRHELPSLCNPLRDPLSWLLLLSSCLTIKAFKNKPSHPIYLLILSGMCLTYATATRETSIVLAFPILIFAISAKIKDRSLPFWKPACFFIITCLLVATPYMIHNYHTTGNALIPGQMVLQGRHFSSLAKNFARYGFNLSGYLIGHYELLSFLIIAGAIDAYKKRNLDTLALTLPAAVCFFLFYATVLSAEVWRYLMVIDFFILPLAGIGAVSIIELVSSHWPFRKSSAIDIQKSFAVIMLIGFLAMLTLNSPADNHHLLKLKDYKKMARSIEATAGEEATLYTAGQKITDIVRFFTSFKPRELSHSSVPILLESYSDPSHVVLLSSSADVENEVSKELELSSIKEFSEPDYKTDKMLDSHSFSAFRVTSWNPSTVSITNISSRTGEHLLLVNIGRISKVKRERITIKFNDLILTESPHDYLNAFKVTLTSAPATNIIAISSDKPVMKRFTASLQHSEDSPEFVYSRNTFQIYHGLTPGDQPLRNVSYPSFTKGVAIMLPVSHAPDEVVLFDTTLIVSKSIPHNRIIDRVQVEGKSTASFNIVTPSRHIISAVPSSWLPATGYTTYSLKSMPSRRSPKEYIKARSTVLHRIPAENSFRIFPGKNKYPGLYGVHKPDMKFADKKLSWLWTKDQTRVFIVLKQADSPTRITLSYFNNNRPDKALPPCPAIKLDGIKYDTESIKVNRGEMELIETSFTVPRGVLTNQVSILDVSCNAWQPKEFGINSDTRVLGLMLHSVSATHTKNE